MGDSSNNPWNVWDTRPGPVEEQWLSTAYIAQDDRSLPNLIPGWRTLDKDRSRLPFPSYLYNGEPSGLFPCMPVTYDQLPWFAVPAEISGDVRVLDFPSIRQSQQTSEDGIPSDGTPLPTPKSNIQLGHEAALREQQRARTQRDLEEQAGSNKELGQPFNAEGKSGGEDAFKRRKLDNGNAARGGNQAAQQQGVAPRAQQEQKGDPDDPDWAALFGLGAPQVGNGDDYQRAGAARGDEEKAVMVDNANQIRGAQQQALQEAAGEQKQFMNNVEAAVNGVGFFIQKGYNQLRDYVGFAPTSGISNQTYINVPNIAPFINHNGLFDEAGYAVALLQNNQEYFTADFTLDENEEITRANIAEGLLNAAKRTKFVARLRGSPEQFRSLYLRFAGGQQDPTSFLSDYGFVAGLVNRDNGTSFTPAQHTARLAKYYREALPYGKYGVIEQEEVKFFASQLTQFDPYFERDIGNLFTEADVANFSNADLRYAIGNGNLDLFLLNNDTQGRDRNYGQAYQRELQRRQRLSSDISEQKGGSVEVSRRTSLASIVETKRDDGAIPTTASIVAIEMQPTGSESALSSRRGSVSSTPPAELNGPPTPPARTPIAAPEEKVPEVGENFKRAEQAYRSLLKDGIAMSYETRLRKQQTIRDVADVILTDPALDPVMSRDELDALPILQVSNLIEQRIGIQPKGISINLCLYFLTFYFLRKEIFKLKKNKFWFSNQMK